jgi:hypothetical protein
MYYNYNWLGYIMGNFFTNSPGRPVQQLLFSLSRVQQNTCQTFWHWLASPMLEIGSEKGLLNSKSLTTVPR